MFDVNQKNFQILAQIVADRTRTLLAWVGAGLSAPAGLPGWPKLREHLSSALQEKANNALPEEQKRIQGRLDDIRRQDDMWIAFRLLREELGQTSYQTSIREALAIADRAPPPKAYQSIWKLRLSGILNLNLDRLATRAFTDVHGTKNPITEFSGRDAGRFAHILQSPTSPFVANLHGIHSDAQSWVFTDEDLANLFSNEGYLALLQTCLLSRAIIFMGLTADDVAAGGHLQRLREKQIDTAPHFWITDKRDAKTQEWAERAGILTIYYNPTNNHAELLECIDALLQYVPANPSEPPITPAKPPGTTPLLSPKEMVALYDPNEIRLAINAEAARLLQGDSEDAYTRYHEFCVLYEEAIHRAWFVPRFPKGTKIFNYTITQEIARKGAFGAVYEAEDELGNTVAIKLLHEAIRDDPEHLQSFRRGVRSMRLLSDAGIEGVVPYRNAYEIPALVVMDFIPGPTLHEFVTQKRADTWELVIEIAVRLTSIIRASHRQPRGILHRDIRPQNVMFKEKWRNADDWDITVLDFDLSWHKGSLEKSVAIDSYSGYVAPEQVVLDRRYSTRSALVDSYGLGMTLYFLRTGREPRFMQPGQTDWVGLLRQHERDQCCRGWYSLPQRYFRLIENSTHIDQSRRWDVGQIEDELLRLRQALSAPESVRSAELLAEELVARAFPGDPYHWSQDGATATRRVVRQVTLSVSGSEALSTVELRAHWTQTGDFQRGTTGQWASDSTAKIRNLLLKESWNIEDSKSSQGELFIHARIDVETVATRIPAASTVLRRVSEALSR